MSGHSKWANIKHRKERSDRKKGKIFSRIMKEVISAVRQSGADPKTNQKLRLAIQKAKEANVPNENIDRNIKKASSTDQQDFSEIVYELYGYGGVGIVVEGMTDNKNRFASEVRIATNKCGGTIASPGAVLYNFDQKGVFRVDRTKFKEDDLFILVTESGAEDFIAEDDQYTVITSIASFPQVKVALQEAKIPVEEAGIEWVPKTYVDVNEEDGQKNTALIDWLENIDDVDIVFHNMK